MNKDVIIIIINVFVIYDQPLGASDYLEISREFDVVIIRGIPRMNLEKKSEARRFITLIDTLYDNMVNITFFILLLSFLFNSFVGKLKQLHSCGERGLKIVRPVATLGVVMEYLLIHF